MKAILNSPKIGAITCFVLFLFAVCLGQINAQDTLAEKAITSTLTIVQPPANIAVESPLTLAITWAAIAGWCLGFLLHTTIKIGNMHAVGNREKFRAFFDVNLFKFIASVLSAFLLITLVVSFIDSVNSSQIKWEKLPDYIKDWGNFAIAVACAFAGFGNSSIALWIFKVSKEKAKMDYQDEDQAAPTGLASGMKP